MSALEYTHAERSDTSRVLSGQARRLPRFRARAAVPCWLLFGPLAVVIWALAHASGIHATIADVAMGLLVRTRARDSETVSPSHQTEEILRPFSAGIALPVFSLTSAGVSLSGAGGFWTSTITWRVHAGLHAGTFTKIFAATWLTSRFMSAHLNPPGSPGPPSAGSDS